MKGRKYPVQMTRRVLISHSNYQVLMIRKIFFPPEFEIDIGGEKIPIKQIDLNPPEEQTQNTLLEN